MFQSQQCSLVDALTDGLVGDAELIGCGGDGDGVGEYFVSGWNWRVRVAKPRGRAPNFQNNRTNQARSPPGHQHARKQAASARPGR